MDNLQATNMLIDVMQSRSTELEIRIGAAEGLGYTGFVIARDALYGVLTSAAYPAALRASAAKALGRTLGACE
ncbi:hypothetical protein NJC38_07355 [Pseudomonas sp. 21LCFQ010]|uniref:hypothetical protein n=1 Tax=Pseudomonas sp. 21LCFQ010 TaxID=2957506 RepID=UPI00209726BF|nr:hypothetical protein [Pseudomonas sp. 21LCFQ010]MCO8161973.1 hypothetical protein [Pseudomonas sp. 21LCFQ010]